MKRKKSGLLIIDLQILELSRTNQLKGKYLIDKLFINYY